MAPVLHCHRKKASIVVDLKECCGPDGTLDQEERMKRIAGLLVAVLLSVGLMYAQDKLTEMTGRICYSKCIKQVDGKAICDPNCREQGDAVLLDDQGKVTKIANQDMVMPYVGKKVKMHCKKTKDKNTMQVVDISEYGG